MKTLPEICDYSSLYERLHEQGLSRWANLLPNQLEKIFSTPHGNLPQWLKAYMQLTQNKTASYKLSDVIKIITNDKLDEQKVILSLKEFMPWRKGPFQINDILIDSEWRSDMKWQRLVNHISPLKNRTVLDIGCGNGYHCWRMLEEGAKLVVGIDPSILFLMQFLIIKHYLGKHPVYLLPVGIESLPSNLNTFDTVFSMGVFYHRKSPIDHLMQLKESLRPGGELVLETLIIDGNKGECLVPDTRYAKMRNVWFLPTIKTLEQWMTRCGFKEIKVIDITITTSQEQRKTQWMVNESLNDFLDPSNSKLTIEGHPAPKRVIIVCNK